MLRLSSEDKVLTAQFVIRWLVIGFQ